VGGYAGSLHLRRTNQLLTWLLKRSFADTVRRQEGEPERFLATAVMDTVAKATPRSRACVVRPREAARSSPSTPVRSHPGKSCLNGFHVYLSLVSDIARRAVTLNEQGRAESTSLSKGVVLIDE